MEIMRKLVIITTAIVLLVAVNFVSASNGHPFQELWDAINGLQRQIDNIELIPGPPGEGWDEARFIALENRVAYLESLLETPTSTTNLIVERSNILGAENITVGYNQVLGGFKITVENEAVDITNLTLSIASTSSTTIEGALQSVRLVDAFTGVSLAGPTNLSHDTLTVHFEDNFTLPVGETVIKVVGDLMNNSGWLDNDTIYASLITPATAIIAHGHNNGGEVVITPDTIVNTNTQTIRMASLSVTRDSMPIDGEVAIGSNDVLLGSWTFDATDSGEDIRVTAILFAASSSNATNLTVFDGNVALGPINAAPPVGDRATSTFALDNPIIVSRGTSKNIRLYGDITMDANPGNSTQFGLTDTLISPNTSVIAYGVSTANRARIILIPDDGAILTYVSNGYRMRPGIIHLNSIWPSEN